MTKQCKCILCWLAVAGWMAVIFWMSAQTGNQSGGASEAIVRWLVGIFCPGFQQLSQVRQTAILEVCHTIVRKGAHFAEYAVLAMLIANALRQYALNNRLYWLLPVAISAVYALTDEVHQYFVPGRACRLLDVGIDTCGAIFGMCLFAAILALLRKRQ